MTKTLIITCDVCDADITRASRAEMHWVDSSIPGLNSTTYFCGFEHMFQFFDARRPKKEGEKCE